MGNAVPELKEQASFVTKANTEDGIYYACKKFGWI
ncbi:HAD hydrolase family protein [Enterococcus italicus]